MAGSCVRRRRGTISMRAVACVHVDLLAALHVLSLTVSSRDRESLFLAQLYVDLFFALRAARYAYV